MECLRLRHAVQFRHRRSYEHGRRLFVANGNQSNRETRSDSTQRHTNKSYLNIQSSVIAEEEQFNLYPDDELDEIDDKNEITEIQIFP